MRNPLLQILAVVLATSFTSLTLAQPPRASASEKTAAPGEFLLTWSLSDPAELDLAAKRLELAEARFNRGELQKDELEQIRIITGKMVKNPPALLTIRSGGGPLSAFLAAASKDRERTINLINAGDAADLETQLPPFVLRNVTWATVLNVLDNFLQPRGLRLNFVGGDHPDLNLAKSVVCVLRRNENSPGAFQSSQTTFESLQLSELIHGEQTIETIVDLIEAAWRFQSGKRDLAGLRMQFHPGSNILLISGPGPAIGVAKQVIASLRKNPVQR